MWQRLHFCPYVNPCPKMQPRNLRLRCSIQIRSFLVQTPLDAWMGFETHPFYKVPGDIWVKISKK